jgi:hypothetical protein
MRVCVCVHFCLSESERENEIKVSVCACVHINVHKRSPTYPHTHKFAHTHTNTHIYINECVYIIYKHVFILQYKEMVHSNFIPNFHCIKNKQQNGFLSNVMAPLGMMTESDESEKSQLRKKFFFKTL